MQCLVLINLMQLLMRHMNNADGWFDYIYLFVDSLQFQRSFICAVICIAVWVVPVFILNIKNASININ